MKVRHLPIDILLFSFLLALLVKIFVFQTYRVESLSMDPTLKPDDRLLCVKPGFLRPYIKGKTAIRRGDIVVFTPPLPPPTEYVKRVMGLPGETLLIAGDKAFVNDFPLQEPWAVFDGPPSSPERIVVSLGSNELYLTGDNRNHSSDSRSFGPVTIDRIESRCIAVYWPPSRLRIFH
jgi:signal peptidase I